jgi:photosystem II stability/assembly factor-like uncharacterized protein
MRLVMVVAFGTALFGLMVSGTTARIAASQDDRVIVRYEAVWERQNSGIEDDLYDVFFANRMVGWAVGRNNTVIKTTDGGRTWRRLMERRDRGTEFREVVFVNENQGWIQARDTLLFTTNGGDTWQPAASPTQGFSYGPAAVVGNTRFQLPVPGTGNVLYRTDDGGRTWTQVTRMPHNNYEKLVFASPTLGWASRGDNPNVPGLWRTEDGGQTWIEVDQRMHRDPDLTFVSTTHGWGLANDPGVVIATTDGGRTWERQTTGIRTTLQDLEFVDAGVGHALCDCEGGTVVRTVDGGWTWNEIGRLGAPDHVRAIHFPDPERGWVVGEKGFIMHYYLVPIYEDALPSGE